MVNLVHALMVMVAVSLSAVVLPAPANADPGPDQVIVGAFINDIQQLDLAAGSFTMDLYVWMRWRGDRNDPTDSIEVMNSNTFENTTTSRPVAWPASRCWRPRA